MIRSGTPWRIFLIGGLLVLVVCAVTVLLLVREEERLQNAERTRRLLVEARMLRDVLAEQWPNLEPGRVGHLLRTLHTDGVDVALVSADGTTCADSTGQRDAPELLAYPEVRQALQTGSGAAGRPHGSSGQPHRMVAVRVGSDADTLGVVWLAGPAWRLTDHREALLRQVGLAVGAATLAMLVLAVALVSSRRDVLRHVVAAARRWSAGDLSADMSLPGPSAYAHLAAALNAVRRRLTTQVDVIENERRGLQALIDNLHEGVIVAGADGRIALINPAAVRLLNLNAGAAQRELCPPGAAQVTDCVGRSAETCIPQYAVQCALNPRLGAPSVAADHAPREGEAPAEPCLEVAGPYGTAHLLLRVSELTLAGAAGVPAAEAGRVVVLTDITALQRALQVRTEFVANASHELRTPLATIRAAVEALLTMDLATETDSARRFVAQIDRHSARLVQMVADLLDLSRLEARGAAFEPQPLEVRRVLEELRTRFAELLQQRGLHSETRGDPPDGRAVSANPYLLWLVLDNLVDNAIKFTEPGGHVTLTFRQTPDQAVFEVADDGCGIAPAEQERVFERFYQVQRSRSGPERGTGLGLSIVRHAVSALRGTVRLESTPGRGTRVTVALPQAPV